MKKILTIVSLGIALVFVSCDGLLDTEPAASVDPEVAQANIDGMEALSVSMHDRMSLFARYGNALMLLGDVLADNTDRHSTSSGRYEGQSINSDGSHFGLWASAFNLINEANFVIDGIDNLENVADETRNRLLGEAYFMRASAYHDLARIYSYEPGREVNGWDEGMILREEPTRDVSLADDRARSTNQETYDLIVSDLEEAITYLEGNDRGTYYANYEAALMLMARVSLYLENWEDAENFATDAINETNVSLVDADTYADNIFESHPNPESIFELNLDPNNESLGSNDALDQYLTPEGWFDIIPSADLLDLYEEDDVRLELYEEHTDGFMFVKKYTGSKGTYTDNIPVYRYPELLLIRAEAYAEMDMETEAIDDLETLRTARGLDPYVTPPSGEDLIMEILDERRRELAFEGHRWFDLKRRGMDITKQGDLPTISYDDHRLLAPLPDSEVDDFPNILQNPGY